MAVKSTTRQPGKGRGGATTSSTLPAVTDESTDLIVPIVVPNMLWNPADPEAYDGGRPTDIDHLREFENSAHRRGASARCSRTAS